MQSQSHFAIFPKREKIYFNLKSANISSISQINNLQNAIGYISYENYTQIEDIAPPQNTSFCNFPKIHFSTFTNSAPFVVNKNIVYDVPKISWIKSNMTKDEYFSKVKSILDYIKKGTCYQVNLTRKFFGEFSTQPNPLHLFQKLYSISPNPYSMLYVIDSSKAVISSSPECFLTRANDIIHSIPIKGSINSKFSINELKNNKDLSENLMITDLVRNDLSRISSNIWVEDFQSINTFSQIHHMSSKVFGKLLPNVTNADCICATFPAGSMTGAPKIKAIEIANELEKMQRGVYSGCIGFVDDFQNFDFSVVIRTIILDGKKFEFQVGGAIVFDSDPQKEFEETIIKAQPILKTLNLESSSIF